MASRTLPKRRHTIVEPPHQKITSAEMWVLAANGLYLLAGLIASLRFDNHEFLLYVAVVFILLILVGALHLQVRFHVSLLWGLTLWGVAHMAGGLLPVPDSWPTAGSGNVLYNWWVIPPERLKFDQVVHAYGFGLTTIACWQSLRHAFANRGVAVTPTVGLITLCVAGAMGFGATNEVIEFAATRLIPDTNVGGYENTGWDLVANAVGATTAGGLLLGFSTKHAAG